MIFSPSIIELLYFAGNSFQDNKRREQLGDHSPDLSSEQPAVPDSIGVFRTPDLDKMPRRGVIYTVAPSYKDQNLIWAGTDDGLIHLTRDGGKKWINVTPPGITSWSKVSIIDAGRFDPETAYAAVIG